MSRIGLLPVEVPDGVDFQIEGETVKAKGKLGELSLNLSDVVEVAREENLVWVRPVNKSKRARTMWGTTRSLIDNIVKGVSAGFEKKLEITGVGYRAQVQGKDLVLQLGHSHEIRYPIPEGIKIDAPTQTEVIVSGVDNQKVGQVASEIRGFRKPEPYKGKGVRYADEIIVRKEGKKK
ncbi:MAG: 50S ribosomal protein L6 [Alphaproteobacteria bacterium MarineAlpha11_Bin1]|nr:MAG: 50S ribosomal protein L6 [Alphaproteobacteria bacterium MarineAlpha11_Bin1]|tara:strand:- start:11822 stop:12355 length:534 start_codon:yes stop_codon:yes gene_type:complete